MKKRKDASAFLHHLPYGVSFICLLLSTNETWAFLFYMKGKNMEFFIQKRRTGKTINLVNSLLTEMVKHPDFIFLFYSINSYNLPNCIKNNTKIKINPKDIRGYDPDKIFLFVDDANINKYFLSKIKYIFTIYPSLKERSYITLDEEYQLNNFFDLI